MFNLLYIVMLFFLSLGLGTTGKLKLHWLNVFCLKHSECQIILVNVLHLVPALCLGWWSLMAITWRVILALSATIQRCPSV